MFPDDVVQVEESQKGSLPFNHLTLGFAQSGALKVISALGLTPGTLQIFLPDGRMIAQRTFDGSSLTGEPLMLEKKLYLYRLNGKTGIQNSGKISGI